MTILLVVGYVVALFVLAAVIVMVRERLARPREPTENEQRARHEAWVAKLTAPDWPAVETRLGRPVPRVLRELYADQNLIASGDFTIRDPNRPGEDGEWNVASFHPASGDSVGPTGFGVPEGALLLATTGVGDEYYVLIDRDEDDTGPVYLYYHDGDDLAHVADSLRRLLSWPRSSV